MDAAQPGGTPGRGDTLDDTLDRIEQALAERLTPHPARVSLCRLREQLRAVIREAEELEGELTGHAVPSWAADDDAGPQQAAAAQTPARSSPAAAGGLAGDLGGSLGDLRLDVGRLTLQRGDLRVRLTPTEWPLLLAFLEAPGELLTRRRLAERAWGTPGSLREVEVYVCRLRRKLQGLELQGGIETVRGVGYRTALR